MNETLKKHKIKIQVGTIVTVLLFTIASTVNIVNMKRDIESEIKTMTNQYEHCNKWYKTLEEEQKEIVLSNTSQDLIIVEIKTKLISIESLLLDLKEDMKTRY